MARASRNTGRRPTGQAAKGQAHSPLAQAERALNSGQPAEAERLCRQALRGPRNRVSGPSKPLRAELHNLLGIALVRLGRQAEAIGAFETAVRLQPTLARAHNNLGATRKALGDLAGAVTAYHEALRLAPDYADAWANLANAEHMRGRYEEAIRAAKTALRLAPHAALARAHLAKSLQAIGRAAEALPHAEQVLAAHPDDAEAGCNLASVLVDLGRYAEARRHCEAVIARTPGHLRAYRILGNIAGMLGNKEAAADWYRRGLAIDPSNGALWRHFAKWHRFHADDPHLRQLREVVEGLPPGVPPKSRSELLLAWSKALEDIGEYRGAFAALMESNALHRRTLAVDRARYGADAARLMRIFSAEALAAARAEGSGAEGAQRAVFIVGMPRSGTTLVEQILASHPQVHGGGELFFLDQAIGPGFRLGTTRCTASSNAPCDEGRADRQEGALRTLTEIGRDYLRRLTALAPEAARITDKMPGNFSKIGLIALALPGARIIHCRRHPLDTALSCLRQRFTHGIEWSYDLEDFAAFYNSYAELMAHWRQVLPQAFIEVDYETLVADVEGEARRLIDYLGLEWSDACLRFYENERAVHTASLAQVRRPIYASSVGAWERYAEELKPLRAAIDPWWLEPYGLAPLPPADPDTALRRARVRHARGERQALVAEAQAYIDAGHPVPAELWTLVCGTQRALGRLAEGLHAAREALALAPENAAYQGNLGLLLKDHGRLDEAESHYRRALELAPEDASHWNNLGVLLFERGRHGEAIDCYERALALKPDYAEAAINLGNVYYDQVRYARAREWYAKALALRPGYVKALRNLGMLERVLGRYEVARELYARALALEPGNPETELGLAKLLGDMGEFEEAVVHGLRAAEDPSNAAEALAVLIRMQRMTPENDDLRQRAEALCAGDLLPRQAVVLHYALGKLYDDLKDYARAFDHYAQANEGAKRLRAPYVPARDRAVMERWLAVASPERIRAAAAATGQDSERPVLIIGMPRSGTTLLEQIIAAHPQAAGAGELTYWGEAFGLHKDAWMRGDFNPAQLRELADGYLRLLDEFNPDALRVVDKMPGNYAYAGLIHAALPKARFIHARRHPVDTCLSIYFQNFNASHTYGNDRAHLVARYRIYESLMTHWLQVLPAERLLEVRYEDLLADQEGWTRRILDFLGLPWDPACLDFHRAEGPVQTASKWQVRQPLYRSSQARWRSYAPWLGPLRELLGVEERASLGDHDQSTHKKEYTTMPANSTTAGTITIDGIPYQLSDLSEAARVELGRLQAVDREIARLQALLGMLQTARACYAQALKQELPDKPNPHQRATTA